jgi:hypothetical protein
MSDFNPSKLNYSALERFARAVDTVMEADQIDHRERTNLITFWAYQYDRPDMPQQLAAAIKRCQGDQADLLITATSMIDPISGEVVAYNPGN